MGKIKVAIAGVGNCASSLIQGVEYYRRTKDELGLMHPEIGGYRVEDIEFVAAFDIDERKLGKDLSQAIFCEPNCTPKFMDVPPMGVKVQRGPVLDGVGKYTKDVFLVDDSRDPVDVAQVLEDSGAEILINYLPTGSEKGSRFYAQEALEAEVGFINAIPTFIASDPEWGAKFQSKNLPLIGDDVKSQFGATILHRVLCQMMADRGIRIDRTYQINIGGNTDFLNMLERERLGSKKLSKTRAVTSLVPIPDKNIHIGPSDYVEWLGDQKICFIKIEATGFGGAPLKLDLKLEVIDSPNSAGVVVDAIRLAKLAMDRGIGGPLHSVCAYLMKSPPIQYPDHIAKQLVEEFIQGKRER